MSRVIRSYNEKYPTQGKRPKGAEPARTAVPRVEDDVRVKGRYSALGELEEENWELADDEPIVFPAASAASMTVEAAPESAPAPEPVPVSEPESAPVVETAPVSTAESAPVVEAAPASELESEPASAPAPASEPESEPAPAPASEPEDEDFHPSFDASNMRLVYESRDGGLCVFEDKAGHLHAVRGALLV